MNVFSAVHSNHMVSTSKTPIEFLYIDHLQSSLRRNVDCLPFLVS